MNTAQLCQDLGIAFEGHDITRARALLVGEDNPRHAAPRFALYPFPAGCAGSRLCCRLLAIPRLRYLREYARVNLCRDRWSLVEARKEADRLVRAMYDGLPPLPMVLLGTRVAKAFAHIQGNVAHSRAHWIEVPHPSGRNRVWNDAHAWQDWRDQITAFLDQRQRAEAVPRGSETATGAEELAATAHLLGDAPR